VTNRKSTGDTISSFAYAYDKAGNRVGVVQANGDRTTWAYDKTYQLTHEHRNGHFAFNVTYTYDPAGNRLVQEDSGLRTTYTYDAANQILTEVAATGRTTYTHDMAGNRTQKEAPAGTTYYTWDEDNRLTVAQPPAGAVTMTYTAVGARVKKETATETKNFLYDFNNLLAELDAGDNTDKLYTQTVEEYGDLVSQYHIDHTDYHAYDAQGSTDALMDDSEYLLARHAYRAFGLEESGGDPNDALAFAGRQRYYHDDEIELYFVRARYCDPTVGRWLSEDPISYGGKVNLYQYVGNNPLTRSDPRGLAFSTEVPLPQPDWSLSLDQQSQIMADNVAKVKKDYIEGQKEPACPGVLLVHYEDTKSEVLTFTIDTVNIRNRLITARTNPALYAYYGTLNWADATQYDVSGTVAMKQFIKLSYKEWRCYKREPIYVESPNCLFGRPGESVFQIPYWWRTTYGDWHKYYTSVEDLGWKAGWTSSSVLVGGTTHELTGGNIMGIGAKWK
jgi:RHS repeat-associated protein